MDDANSSGFDDRATCVSIVKAGRLVISFRNKAKLIVIKTSIGFSFCFKNPFTSYNISIWWRRNKGPSFVVVKSLKFIKHSLTSVRIFISLSKGCGVRVRIS